MRQIWLTAIGRDRPGIVARIAQVLLDHGLNIEDSQMRILGGRFSMMLLLRGDANEEALIRDLLRAGRELGLDYIYVHPIEAADVTAAEPTHVLTVYGADHPGIVAAFATALADNGANITDLQTRLSEGAYVMFLELVLPAGAEIDDALAQVAREQGVEASLRTIERETL